VFALPPDQAGRLLGALSARGVGGAVIGEVGGRARCGKLVLLAD
jgi:hypothetical protein